MFHAGVVGGAEGRGVLRNVNTFWVFLCVGSFRERHELGELGGRTWVQVVGAHGQPEERLLLPLLQSQPIFEELREGGGARTNLLIHFILRENVCEAKKEKQSVGVALPLWMNSY